MPSLSDQSIEPNDFQSFYFDYYAIAHRTANYILKSADAADDVAQNVFLKLWDKQHQLHQIDNPKAYITQMARNGALDTLKKNQDLGEEHIPLEFVEDVFPTDERADDIRLALEQAVARLSPKCRLVFSLSRFEGLSNPEIAEYLDISIRTVETQVSTALKLFRTEFKHYFIDFFGWGLLLVFQVKDIAG